MEIITAKTNAVVTLSTMSVLSFHWRRVWQLNTRLVHFQECSKSVQITFHLIQNEMFKDLFKRLLQSLQASTEVKRPRSQTVRPKLRFSSDIYKSVAVKFVFSKLANFVGTSLPPSSRSPHWIVQLVWMFSTRYDVLKDIGMQSAGKIARLENRKTFDAFEMVGFCRDPK